VLLANGNSTNTMNPMNTNLPGSILLSEPDLKQIKMAIAIN
jgi:hypothetical protein